MDEALTLESVSPNQIKSTVRRIYNGSEPIPKIGGFWMWFVGGINGIKDAIDFGCGVLEIALAATVVAIPISILIYLIQTMLAIGMFFVNFAFFYFESSHFGTRFIGKLIARQSINVAFKIFPLMSMVPMNTIIFSLSVIWENRLRKGGRVSAAMEVITEQVYRLEKGGKLK